MAMCIASVFMVFDLLSNESSIKRKELSSIEAVAQKKRCALLIVARTHDDVVAGDLEKIRCLGPGLLLSAPQVVIGNPA